MKESDKHIIQQIRSGDVTAFTRLIERYQHMAYTLALSIMKNREDAEEVAQDAFMKAYRHLDEFRSESSFSTWLYRIIYNTALSAKRLKRITFTDIESKEANCSEVNQHLASDKLEVRDRKIVLKQAIATLNEDDAFIVILFYYKELSTEEIQQITGLTVSNIKVKLHRSRKQLLHVLSKTLKNELPELL
jgi:RNA polymerase sigma-70 factor (ECF subfamily)